MTSIKLVKKQAKKVYKGKDGKERHYWNYYLVAENGKRLAIRTFKPEDMVILDCWCEYER